MRNTTRFTFLLGMALVAANAAGCGSFTGTGTDAQGARGNSFGGSYGGSYGDADAAVGAEEAPEISVSPADETAPPVNPFVSAEHDPFSTFGADVDTASYDLWRRAAREGWELYPDQVRTEDFVNYFDYDYPTPAYETKIPFAITLAAAKHPLGRAGQLLRIGIQAKAPPVEEKRPANLVFLVDTSGSMSGPDKLPLVQTVLRETLEVLEPTDRVSIVTYAGATRVALKSTLVSERNTILRAIDQFSAEGGTAGGAGLNLAYTEASHGFIEGGINHVLLCTDGDFNVGPSSTEELLELIQAKRATGVTLTALGFGVDNLNDGMMEAVSNAGNGIHGFIGSSDAAYEYVHERMLSTLVHVAKDMKIQVEFNPAHVRAYRLIGYENRAIADEDFRNDRVDGGEVGAGHRVTALYEIIPAGGTVPAPDGAPALQSGEAVSGAREIAAGDLVRVKVRWKEVTATDDDPAQEVASTLTPAEVTSGLEATNLDLLWAAAVAGYTEQLRLSPYATAGELSLIGGLVKAQKERDGARREFAELFELATR